MGATRQPSSGTTQHDIDDTSAHGGVSGATENNVLSFDADGLPKDSSKAATDVHGRDHDIDSTADHNGVSGATENNLVSFDANGLPKDSGVAASDVHADEDTIAFVLGNGSDAISTGEKGHVQIDFACAIKAATLLADQSGSLVVDVWKDTYANFPPTDADSITASAPPALSAAQKSTDSALTGWTTAVSAGDILAFNVDSASTVTRVTVSLKVERT